MPNLSEQQIQELEGKCGLTFPEFYRLFLSDHDENIETLNFGSGPLGENELMVEPRELVNLNEDVRSPDLWFFGEHPWPAGYFASGMDVYGGHYFIETTGQNKGILFQDIAGISNI